ncbi:DUF1707 and DUF2154 domain-containing protein [Streptomyces sp. JJ66]|uniref:DUF1707 SHOCT-like domain-containing protein n=1 Tax=Streptomyces sp. JJ66 TaxID=2803843 RepID=UPI001C586865|nr:DUF1707 domain-containing protein [Streptomyces sp. JJ66]MBW1600512.1 DUF1707 and DUF2154 domain-containing protein [Streptomyces sp. JJ66]
MNDKLPEMRASDAERDQIAEVLRDALAEGRLTTEEFGERLDAVYQARTRSELVPLTADLPQGAGPEQDVRPAARGRDWAARFGGRATSTGALALMSGFVRKGTWVAPRRFTAVAFWGGGEIDLREARFEDREIVIQATAIMGGVNVIVPPDAEVLIRGVGIMGGFDHSAAGSGAPGAVRITVTGFAFWGGVGVERRALGKGAKGSKELPGDGQGRPEGRR